MSRPKVTKMWSTIVVMPPIPSLLTFIPGPWLGLPDLLLVPLQEVSLGVRGGSSYHLIHKILHGDALVQNGVIVAKLFVKWGAPRRCHLKHFIFTSLLHATNGCDSESVKRLYELFFLILP